MGAAVICPGESLRSSPSVVDTGVLSLNSTSS